MADERLGASFSIDVSQLQNGLKTANRLIRESQSEFKAAAAGMDDWTKSEDGLNARIRSLNQITAVQAEKVNALKTQYNNLIKDGLDPASDRAIALRTQINNEEAALRSNEAELRKNSDALQNFGDESEEAGNKVSKLGDVAKAAGKAMAAAFAAAGAAVVAITKSAIDSYAEYEQLVGGVETLFKSSSDKVVKYANDAYKTAGISANQYMETATSFSASLLQSLGGDTSKAADVANRAIIDMSDNANKMGTSMEMIQNAYQGFAKQNYTMLDNLKLGYGGTKTEMERLIADANAVKKANGEMANLSIDSFADITEAIHIIQNEMGITGTTAKEASETIQGSVSAMRSAWQNLLTGLADDNADIDLLINNLIDSGLTAINNIIPRILIVLDTIPKAIEKILPEIPPIIEKLLPPLLKAATKVVNGIVKILPQIVDTIMQVIPQLITALIEMLPTLTEAIVDIIVQLIDAIADMLPVIVDAIMQILPLLITKLIEAIPQLLQAAIQLLMAIVQAIPTIIQALVAELPKIIDTLITTLVNALPLLVEGAIQLLMGIIDAIPVIVDALIVALPEIINTIVNALVTSVPLIIDAAIQLLMGIIDAIPEIIVAIVENLPQIVMAIINALVSNVPLMVKAGFELLFGLIKAIPQIIVELVKNGPKIVAGLVKGIVQAIPQMVKAGGDLLKGLWQGIKDMGKWLWDKISGFFSGIVDGIKGFFGIKSPSKLMENVIGKNMALGIGKGFVENIGQVNDEIIKSMQDLENPNISANVNGVGGFGSGKAIVINQYNNYSQEHSRYELYKSKQQTAAAVRLAMGTV